MTTPNIPAMLLRSFGNWQEGAQDTDLSGLLRGYLGSQGVDLNQLHTPPVDLVEDDTSITMYMDVPGLNGDDIDVDFYNNKISVTMTRWKPYETAQMSEIAYGEFKRKVRIPICVTSQDSVTSSCKDGVLKIVIDKANEEKNRFKVRVGDGVGTASTGASAEGD